MAQKITFNRAAEKNKELEHVDAIILCGGLGTRLREVVKDKPKAMAEIGDAPFLDILIDSLLSHGFKRIILAVGHLKDQLKTHYRAKRFAEHEPYEILFSEESVPLGTGGALKHALRLMKGEQFLAMNGDCFCEMSFSDFYRMHTEKSALISIALATMKDTSEYGQVLLGHEGRIIGFLEKSPERVSGLVNAGIYLMHKNVLAHMPEAEIFSLERDMFPRLIAHNCRGFATNSEVLDIGVPARYAKAIELFSDNGQKI